MPREGLEVADVFRRFGPAFREQHGASLSGARRRAMIAIESCRTAALGGHVERCGACGHQRIAYDSCRNRNCPKCQCLARAQWIADRQAELLDVPYFHVVFTVPAEIEVIAFQNQTVVYDILFRAASETLRTIAADPEHLGAEIGFLGVLHTWGQNLLHHPHIHFLVPGGGIAPDGESWIACRPGFFLPVRVLSRMFRGQFLHDLEQAFRAGELNFFSAHRHLHEPAAFLRYLAPVWNTEWVVYAKRPFAGPAQVLEYVGRYTHRVAISNNRLVSMPLSDPCAARRISPHPLLRLPGQLPSCAEARALPGTARDGIARSSGRSAGWLSRSLSGAHRAVIARMSALPNWHHGGDWMRRTTRELRAGAKYIMSTNRGRHSVKPNRPRHRSADAWATCAIPIPTPGPIGQIQAQLTDRRPRCRRKCSQSTGRNASKGRTSIPAGAIKRP